MSDSQSATPLIPETWTTKEVIADLKADIVKHLDKQDGTLATISSKMDQKADKSDLVPLWARIDTVDGRLKVVEVERETETRARKRAWIVGSTSASLIVAVVVGLLEAHVI